MMVLLPLLGFATALAHHMFYRHLSGNSIDSAIPSLSFYGHHVASQSVASAIGNALAYAAKSFFAAAIGQAFTQVLWYYLRHQSISIRHINAMFVSNGNPFTPASLPAWRSAFGLSTLSLLACSMTFITIFSSGALRIASAPFAVSQSCNVSTVNLTYANLGVAVDSGPHGEWVYSMPLPLTTSLAYTVLMTGTYLLPPSPCGVCQYDTTFMAPALNCTNITDSFDFSISLPTHNTTLVLWNATYSFDTNGYNLQVASRDSTDPSRPPKATACTAFNATYHVRVQHGNLSTTVDVLDIILENPLTTTMGNFTGTAQFGALADAMALRLSGSIVWVYNSYGPPPDSAVVIYSPLGMNRSGYWSLEGDRDPIIALPLLMQNLSISLLSNPIKMNGYPIISSTPATCLHSVLAYNYTPWRLLSIYGVGILATTICVVIGFVAIHQNQVEGSLDVSRLLYSVLNDRLFGKDISLDTQLRAEQNPRGKLVPFYEVP